MHVEEAALEDADGVAQLQDDGVLLGDVEGTGEGDAAGALGLGDGGAAVAAHHRRVVAARVGAQVALVV